MPAGSGPGRVRGMDTNPAPTKPKHLRALLDGRPVDFGALAAAVWNGSFSDLSRGRGGAR